MTEIGGPADPGLIAVQRLFDGLKVDDEWSVRGERGFTWWGHRLAQHVTASPLVDPGDGSSGSVVRVWTDVVTDVPEGIDPNPVLTEMNRHTTLSAFVWDPGRRTVSACAAFTVFDDTVEMWSVVLVVAAMLQATAAHSSARALATTLDAWPAVSHHPVSGRRPEPDGMLHVPAGLAGSIGQEASRFRGDLMDALASFDFPWALADGDSEGFVAEVPFVSDKTTLDAAFDRRPPGTALVRVVTNEPHPVIGSGALLTLAVPLALKGDRAASAANELNRLAAAGVPLVPLLGAWCADADGGLFFDQFVPSAVARPGLLQNLAVCMAALTRWSAMELLSERRPPLADLSHLELYSDTLDGLIEEMTELLRLMIEDTDEFLIVDRVGGQRYVQFLTEDGDWMRCEAAGDVNLENEYRPTDADRAALADLGWHEPVGEDKAANYYVDMSGNDLAERAGRLAAETLWEIFGYRRPADATLTVHRTTKSRN